MNSGWKERRFSQCGLETTKTKSSAETLWANYSNYYILIIIVWRVGGRAWCRWTRGEAGPGQMASPSQSSPSHLTVRGSWEPRGNRENMAAADKAPTQRFDELVVFHLIFLSSVIWHFFCFCTDSFVPCFVFWSVITMIEFCCNTFTVSSIKNFKGNLLPST